METYTVIVDAGKPFEYPPVVGDEALKALLKEIYINDVKPGIEEDFPVDVIVLNSQGEDITDSQFVNELVGEIMEGD